MKRQTTLAELVTELKDQNLQKNDFVVPANLLSMENGFLVVNNYNNNVKKNAKRSKFFFNNLHNL